MKRAAIIFLLLDLGAACLFSQVDIGANMDAAYEKGMQQYGN